MAYRTPAVALVLALGLLTWLSFGTFGALEPLFYRDVLGTAAETLGYVNAVFGVGLFVGAVTLDRAAGRLTSLRALVVLTALCGLGVFAYAGTSSLPVVVLGGLYLGHRARRPDAAAAHPAPPAHPRGLRRARVGRVHGPPLRG